MTFLLWLLVAIFLGASHSTRHRHNYGGFSVNRLLGVSRAKAQIGRSIGVPLTRSGRQRKLGSYFWKW